MGETKGGRRRIGEGGNGSKQKGDDNIGEDEDQHKEEAKGGVEGEEEWDAIGDDEGFLPSYRNLGVRDGQARARDLVPVRRTPQEVTKVATASQVAAPLGDGELSL